MFQRTTFYISNSTNDNQGVLKKLDLLIALLRDITTTPVPFLLKTTTPSPAPLRLDPTLGGPWDLSIPMANIPENPSKSFIILCIFSETKKIFDEFKPNALKKNFSGASFFYKTWLFDPEKGMPNRANTMVVSQKHLGYFPKRG